MSAVCPCCGCRGCTWYDTVDTSVATTTLLQRAVLCLDRTHARALTAEAELARLTACDAACGEIHRICSDAGIPPGNVVARVRALVEARSGITAAIDAMLCADMAVREHLPAVEIAKTVGELRLGLLFGDDEDPAK